MEKIESQPIVEKNKIKLEKGEVLIGKRYIMDARKRLGSGGFGDIYFGRDITNDTHVAIKLERRGEDNLLDLESLIYTKMADNSKITNNFSWICQKPLLRKDNILQHSNN
jgi:hypothetical protein